MNRALGVVAVTAVLATGCASRGTVNRLQSDVTRLRAELADARSAQELSTREIARARSELQALDARTRELGSGVRTASDDLARLAARVSAAEDEIKKTRALVEAPPPAPATTAPAAPAPAPRAPVERRAEPREARERSIAPDQAYATALALYRAREYGQAVLDFTDLIGKYPKHPLAANAQYWIGEAYYVQRDYRQALLEFQKVIEMGAGKVPDALVKTGLCHWSLHDPVRARAAWQAVVREHGGSEPATIARALLRRHESAIR
jgi:tol-pal system protein YbgF